MISAIPSFFCQIQTKFVRIDGDDAGRMSLILAPQKPVARISLPMEEQIAVGSSITYYHTVQIRDIIIKIL